MAIARGTLYIISAPSGGGKTSLVHELIKILPHVIVSISHTTRLPRVGEQDGVNYHFVTQAAFKALLKENVFLEHAIVFGHTYGTSRQWVEEQLSQGRDVILEIDWQGAQQIRQLMNDVISIFILPPSREKLSERLHERGQDDASVIANRLALASTEISHAKEYDYWVINDEFKTALNDLIAILRTHRLRSEVQEVRHRDLINSLI